MLLKADNVGKGWDENTGTKNTKQKQEWKQQHDITNVISVWGIQVTTNLEMMKVYYEHMAAYMGEKENRYFIRQKAL